MLLFFSANQIGMDEHSIGQPSHGRRPLVEHGWPSAIRRASFAISDCWQPPQLLYGVDSITRRFRADGIMKVFSTIAKQRNQYGFTTQRSDRGDCELRDAKKTGKP